MIYQLNKSFDNRIDFLSHKLGEFILEAAEAVANGNVPKDPDILTKEISVLLHNVKNSIIEDTFSAILLRMPTEINIGKQ